jgi:hypothetical protein
VLPSAQTQKSLTKQPLPCLVRLRSAYFGQLLP